MICCPNSHTFQSDWFSIRFAFRFSVTFTHFPAYIHLKITKNCLIKERRRAKKKRNSTDFTNGRPIIRSDIMYRSGVANNQFNPVYLSDLPFSQWAVVQWALSAKHWHSVEHGAFATSVQKSERRHSMNTRLEFISVVVITLGTCLWAVLCCNTTNVTQILFKYIVRMACIERYHERTIACLFRWWKIGIRLP